MLKLRRVNIQLGLLPLLVRLTVYNLVGLWLPSFRLRSLLRYGFCTSWNRLLGVLPHRLILARLCNVLMRRSWGALFDIKFLGRLLDFCLILHVLNLRYQWLSNRNNLLWTWWSEYLPWRHPTGPYSLSRCSLWKARSNWCCNWSTRARCVCGLRN